MAWDRRGSVLVSNAPISNHRGFAAVIAIEEARRAGLLGRSHWIDNIVAGVVVGVVAIPLAMAFAVASGVKPEQGLYTAIVAGLAVALFGGSRVQVAGPTGAFAVLLAGVAAQHGFAGLQVATMLAGAMLVVFGLLRLGSVIKFIPESVILGFTAGIALVIWIGQWPNFFGIPAAEGSPLQAAWTMLGSLPSLSVPTAVIGVACVVLIALWPRVPVLGAVPGPVVALVGATAFVAIVRPEGVATIGSMFGGVPRGLPALALPHITRDLVVALIHPAFSIALLGAIESLLSATVADGMTGTRHNANQELLGQGVANVASSLFGGFAATGAIARTATSIRHGGTSPIAAIVHVLVLVAVVVVLAPLAASVPLAALAGILFVVAFNMSDITRVARTIRRAPRTDVAIMLVTLALTVSTDIVLAVEVGVGLAMALFLRRMADSVEVRSSATEQTGAEGGPIDAPEGTLIYRIDGPFFFGAIEQFEHALATTHTAPDRLIIDLTRVPFIDLSGLVALRDAIEALQKRDVEVVLCGANANVAPRLVRAEIASLLGTPVDATLSDVLGAG